MTTTISEKEFQQFQQLIYQQVGITLGDQKKSLVVSRLGKRLRELALPTFQAYYDYVLGDGGGEELITLLDLISTNKTDFFREPGHFQFLREKILPFLHSERRVRIWSSASSSGEEPYTIAMTLYDGVSNPGEWDFKILASDISTRVLAKGAAGIYEEEKIASLPPDIVRRHFLRGQKTHLHKVRVKTHLSNMIAFRRINLMASSYPIKSPLDVIFCRNVMIYFDRPTQGQLMHKFYRYLKPGGYLFIGHSESLQWVDHPFAYVAPTIYRKAVAEPSCE